MSAKSLIEDFDGVLVAGAGPVGLFTALKLARAGINVLVLEELEGIIRSPRAAGYQWPVPQLFDEIGVLEDAKAVGVFKRANQFRRPATGAIDSMSLAILDTPGEVPFDLQLGQDALADIMLRHVDEIDGAEVRWDCRVTGLEQDAETVTVTVNDNGEPRQIRAPWLVGADGSHSKVRDELGLSFEGHTWPDRFVASNVYYDFEAYGYGRATFVRDPVHWAIIIKINNDGLWRVGYGEDPKLSEDEIAPRVAEHYKTLMPGSEPYEVAMVGSYRVHERAAERLRVGRVLLAGDAAHICNPSGGYGLLGGFMTANALGDGLIGVVAGTDGDDVLDRYSEERLRIYHEVISPRATEYKRVLSESDPEQMRRDDEGLRKASTDPEILRNAMSFSSRFF